MKRFHIFLSIVCTFLLISCAKDKCTTKTTYLKYTPIYKSVDEIRQPISFESARELKNPGKIYLYHSFILVNEQLEGIHIFDNSNPSNPVNLGFLKIQGNLDMAIKNNMLYADSYIDLLTIDLSNPLNATLVDRDNNVFPSYGTDDNGRLLVAYKSEMVTEEVACGQIASPWGTPFEQGAVVAMSNQGGLTNSGFSSGRSGDATAGVGGSMARFTVNGDYLYTVDNSSLHSFNITNRSNPEDLGSSTIGWANIETIFPYQNMLFIGSNTGMFIYDISSPSQPTLLSQFEHANACDPVFVSGNRAYVTLRGGTRCQNFTNQLEVVDISDIQNPSLVSTHAMSNPHGLSIKNDKLYLCDGAAGLKVFDSSDDFQISNRLLYHDNSISTYDVIASPYRNVILVVGSDGLIQYDNSNPSNMIRLSKIPVVK
jgi:hypothetical protein